LLLANDYNSKIFSLESSNLVETRLDRMTNLTCGAFRRDGASLIAGTLDGNTLLWENFAKEPRKFSTSNNTVTTVCASGDWIFAGTIDGTIRRWRLSQHQDPVRLEQALDARDWNTAIDLLKQSKSAANR
jgi:WD40 repeat protein